MRHLLSTQDLSRDEAIALLDIAEDMADVAGREVNRRQEVLLGVGVVLPLDVVGLAGRGIVGGLTRAGAE